MEPERFSREHIVDNTTVSSETSIMYSMTTFAVNDSRKPSLTTDDDTSKTVVFGVSVDSGALVRMMYILSALTVILLAYFGVKLWK